MKKKKLKLNLKKDVISKLQSQSIIGGYTDMTACMCPQETESPGCTDPNSDNGCHTNPDETMTCPAWGC